jgi:hypothetical protein
MENCHLGLVKKKVALVENPLFKPKVFNFMTFTTMFQLDFLNFWLWQLPIELICLL